MFLQAHLYNLLRAGGYLIRYVSGEGLIMTKPHSGEIVAPELVRSIYTSAKDSKPGDIGFVYEETWKKRDRHNGTYLDWTVDSERPANLKCTRISELPEGAEYIKSLQENKRIELLKKARSTKFIPKTPAMIPRVVSYLGRTLLPKRIADKYKGEESMKAPSNILEIAKAAAALCYVNSCTDGITYLGQPIRPIVTQPDYDAARSTLKEDPVDALEEHEPRRLDSVDPDWIKYLLSLSGEQELNYRATKQIVVRPDRGSPGSGFGEEYISLEKGTQVGHEEVFDRAVGIKTDSAKETALMQLLLCIAPELICQPELFKLLAGYRFQTKESDRKSGHQSKVYGIVSGLLKYDINKSIYKVPRNKSCGFPRVKRTIHGITKEYVDLKQLGITEQHEYVCLEETRGKGFSDFKQLWIMYKVYLLLQPNLKKITKAQKELLNITGVDKATQTKLLTHIQHIRDTGVPNQLFATGDIKASVAAVNLIADAQIKSRDCPNPVLTGKYSKASAGGKDDFMPKQSEINAAWATGGRIGTTLKLLRKCKDVTEYPTTMGQMFNMVYATGKYQRQGDRYKSKLTGKVYYAPVYAGTFWQPGMPIEFGGTSKLFRVYGKTPVKTSVRRVKRYFKPAEKAVLVIDTSESLDNHKRWEPVIPFPVAKSVKTTGCKFLHLDEGEGTVIDWGTRKANYEAYVHPFNVSWSDVCKSKRSE